MSVSRWHQRLDHFSKALAQLQNAVSLRQSRALSQLEIQGFIKAFEFTFELAWNVMRDYFTHQGITSITGSRDAFREAFQKGLIVDGERWMEMIESRNLTSHSYNESVAVNLVTKIGTDYFPLFEQFLKKMVRIRNGP